MMLNSEELGCTSRIPCWLHVARIRRLSVFMILKASRMGSPLGRSSLATTLFSAMGWKRSTGFAQPEGLTIMGWPTSCGGMTYFAAASSSSLLLLLLLGVLIRDWSAPPRPPVSSSPEEGALSGE